MPGFERVTPLVFSAFGSKQLAWRFPVSSQVLPGGGGEGPGAALLAAPCHACGAPKGEAPGASRWTPDIGETDAPSGLPMQRQPQMGVERCGPFKGPADFLRVSLTDSLLLDMAVLRRHRQVPVLVTAMSLDGAYTDEYGFDITRAEPLEDTENNLLQLQLSDDGKSVDVYKPGLGIRTSDLESLEAVTQGLGDGWLGSLERAPCLEEPGAIVVDAQQLIWAGFFAAYIADDAVNFRILEAKAYPKNVDVAVEYLMGDMGPIKVGFSLVLLPQVSMAPRPMDDRLLYFSSEFLDLGYREAPEGEAPNHEVDRGSSTIWRYNLQALPGQQIRVHVDPSVPARWREFFRQGIEAWNAAFEVAGLRNSIRGVLPSDQDYDISDARFSTISWDLSDEVASMGIAKVDPRSGEIIKSDITMSSGWVKAWLQDLDELAPGLTHDAMPKGPRDRRISMLQTGSRHSAQVRIERGGRSARSSANAHLRQVMNHSQLQEPAWVWLEVRGDARDGPHPGLEAQLQGQPRHLLGVPAGQGVHRGARLIRERHGLCPTQHS
ncbi:unnamed protein product [Effrenium voratum]|nr:unnamed protein product [Effrenium voratum]